MKKLIITLCSFGLLLTAAQGQQNGPMGPGGDGTGMPPVDMPPPPPSLDRPGVEIPDEIMDLHADISDLRDALRISRQAVIDGLGEDATAEDIRAALEDWRVANEDAITDARELATTLREWFQANRPERPGVGNSPEMVQRRQAFRENVAQMQANRQQLREQLRDPALTEEDRQQIMAQFREEQRNLIRERQSLKRQERIDQGGVGGDRRPGQ